MRIRRRRALQGVTAALCVAAALAGCGTAAKTGDAPPGASLPTPSPTPSPTPPTTAPAPATTTLAVAPPDSSRMVNWFDLAAGDCLADPPPVDPTVISVRVVDCATAHRAETYLRSPMALNNALADIADRDCGAGFSDYTGQSISGSPYTTTYLIDSNQNRTSSNPNPSTVICLLQSADDQPLTGSARR